MRSQHEYKIFLAVGAVAAVLTLGACGNSNSQNQGNKTEQKQSQKTAMLKLIKQNT